MEGNNNGTFVDETAAAASGTDGLLLHRGADFDDGQNGYCGYRPPKKDTMVKEKQNSTRTYDRDGFRRRAACVCVRDAGEQEVLLVSGSRNPGVWIVPGGGIEPTEETSMAAIREVLEEAGVKGKLDRCLGVFDSADGKTRTCVFVLIVHELLDDWDEAKTMGRQRKWFTVAEAKKHLEIHRPAHCSYLDRLRPSDSPSSSPSFVTS